VGGEERGPPIRLRIWSRIWSRIWQRQRNRL